MLTFPAKDYYVVTSRLRENPIRWGWEIRRKSRPLGIKIAGGGCQSDQARAQSAEHPEAPVCLDILADGQLIGQTLANRYRKDLERAGLGSGRHSFEFLLPAGVIFVAGSVEVRRSSDGVKLLSAKIQERLAVEKAR